MVAGIWWFFTLIMVSSYTANLAAFLTVENPTSPFDNVKGLAYNKDGIKYGAKRTGSTLLFFKESTRPVYMKMWEYMSENFDEVMTGHNDEGVRKAMEEDYAYIMESTSVEYTIERFCNLTQVGGLLDNKGYGIAMRKNAPYRNALSAAVLKLQETGVLERMKRKWWKEKRGGGTCEAKPKEDAQGLTLTNVGGVFVVLVGGVMIACFITVFELLWTVTRVSRKEKVPFTKELMEEIKFVAKFHGSTKPIRKRKLSCESTDEEIIIGKNNQQLLGWLNNEEKKTPLP